MSLRTGTRLTSRAVRSSARFRRSNGVSTIRMNSSSHGEHKAKSDTIWMLGSAAVFGPALIYLLGPFQKKEHAHYSSSSPEFHKPKPEKKDDDVPLKDDEGEEASADDVKSSLDRGYKADSPKDAKAAEAEPGYEAGAEGQSDDGDDKPEQKEKPSQKKNGTLQDKGDEGPTDLDDARKESRKESAPKSAAGKDDEGKDDSEGNDSEEKE